MTSSLLFAKAKNKASRNVIKIIQWLIQMFVATPLITTLKTKPVAIIKVSIIAMCFNNDYYSFTISFT